MEHSPKYEYQLSASIICGNVLRLDEDLTSLETSGAIDSIHFDVMDGTFVPRLGLHPEALAAIKKHCRLPIHAHLMIDEPEQFLEAFAQEGATSLTVHAESTKHLHRALKKIKDLGIQAGVALNPGTPLSVLDYVTNSLDRVLLMAINPGIVGHKLIPEMLDKIRDVRARLNPDVVIEVDGGVTLESAPEMIVRGANSLVCGTSIIFNKNMPVGEKAKEARQQIQATLHHLSP